MSAFKSTLPKVCPAMAGLFFARKVCDSPTAAMVRLTLGEKSMTVEIDASYVSVSDSGDLLEIMSNSCLDFSDLLDEAERYGWDIPEKDLDLERVKSWIFDADLTDSDLMDLSYRLTRELVDRLNSVRQCADSRLETNRQNMERIRELERAAGPDAATA
tara:strand:- start:771 stop:1247 length:477 start_codon:yes stop_codon:yes gene_type:complete